MHIDNLSEVQTLMLRAERSSRHYHAAAVVVALVLVATIVAWLAGAPSWAFYSLLGAFAAAYVVARVLHHRYDYDLARVDEYAEEAA